MPDAGRGPAGIEVLINVSWHPSRVDDPGDVEDEDAARELPEPPEVRRDAAGDPTELGLPDPRLDEDEELDPAGDDEEVERGLY